jgi:hypothetical protein
MKLSTVTFGDRLYRLENNSALTLSWFQRSPDAAAECSQCGNTLFFTFGSRTNPEQASSAATSHIIPSGVRCDCFLAERSADTYSLPYHAKLSQRPLPITPVESQNLDEPIH